MFFNCTKYWKFEVSLTEFEWFSDWKLVPNTLSDNVSLWTRAWCYGGRNYVTSSSCANFSPRKPFGSPSWVKGWASAVSSGNNCPSQQRFFSFKPPIKVPQLGEWPFYLNQVLYERGLRLTMCINWMFGCGNQFLTCKLVLLQLRLTAQLEMPSNHLRKIVLLAEIK